MKLIQKYYLIKVIEDGNRSVYLSDQGGVIRTVTKINSAGTHFTKNMVDDIINNPDKIKDLLEFASSVEVIKHYKLEGL